MRYFGNCPHGSVWPFALVCVAGMLCATGPALGQPPMQESDLPNPRILTLVPCGGRAGTSVEVTFTGTDLEEPDDLLFSHAGIKAEPVAPPAKPEPAAKKPPPKPQRRGRRRQANLVISKFKITIPPDAPPGVHDVRLVNKWGVSNPRAFVVGDLAEVLEKEPNNDVPEAQRVAVNTTVNGTISAPTDVDYFVFGGKKGQRVVVSCLASSIDSRLEPELELYDVAGRRLAYNRNYANADALLDCTLPADGDYFVRVFAFTHTAGDAEHFYRLSVSTAPWIDAVFPPVVEPGKSAKVMLYGRNLPGGKPDPTAMIDGRVLETLAVSVDPPHDPAALQRLTFSGHVPPNATALDGFEYRLRNPVGVSNPYLLTYARAPVVLDNGANDSPDKAQPVTLPCEIAGRIEKKYDRDWYTFAAKKGEVYGIELSGERIGAPTDMALTLYNLPAKQILADLDDDPETLNPIKFFTHSSDPPYYRWTVPADGKYLLQVRSQDADLRGGPRLLYRVSIAPEQPDFRLIVMAPADRRPDACRLLRGGSQFYTVLVWHRDGFNGNVALAVEGLPAGVVCPPQSIAPGLTYTQLVINATPAAAEGVYPIKVKGTATINGKTVVREARPASVTWPIQPGLNLPTISRLDHSLMLAVNDRAPFNLAATIDKPMLLQGDKANITLKMTRLWPDFKTPLQAIFDPPKVRNRPVLNVPNVTLAPKKDEAKIAFTVPPNLPPGTYNLVFRGTAPIPYNKDPMAKQKPNTNVVLPSTPLAVTVVPKQLATVKLAAPTLTAKAGSQGEVVVQVARMYDYAGEFKVKLVLPPKLKGFDGSEVTIPAGKNEAKLIVKVGTDAPPGNHANLVVRATALYDGKLPVTHEAKLAVMVVKK